MGFKFRHFEIAFAGSTQCNRYIFEKTLGCAVKEAKKQQRRDNKSEIPIKAAFYQEETGKWIDVTEKIK